MILRIIRKKKPWRVKNYWKTKTCLPRRPASLDCFCDWKWKRKVWSLINKKYALSNQALYWPKATQRSVCNEFWLARRGCALLPHCRTTLPTIHSYYPVVDDADVWSLARARFVRSPAAHRSLSAGEPNETRGR